MNLNNKQDLSEKNIQNKNYKNFYFKWSKLVNSKLGDLSILESDVGESIYKDLNISNMTLEKVLCWNSFFSDCVFENIQTKNFDSRDNEYDHCIFKDCIFDSSCLRGSILQNCNFENIKFIGTDLKKIEFKNCIMKNVNFENCDLFMSNFKENSPINTKIYKTKIIKIFILNGQN